MSEKSRLYASKVWNVANAEASTGYSGDRQRALLDLPRDLKGKTTLDLCAGFSNLSTLMVNAGSARSIAIDIKYAKAEEVLREHKKQVAGMLEQLGMSKEKNRVDQHRKNFEEMISSGVQVVAGSVTDIPLKDRSVDLVTSFSGLFGTLDHDSEVLGAALSDAGRVISDNGEIRLFCFITKNTPIGRRIAVITDEQLENQAVAMENFCEENPDMVVRMNYVAINNGEIGQRAIIRRRAQNDNTPNNLVFASFS